mmetsp:Transcript_28699/g.67821  ORF Transcript_28699/g.67821 Transcript_28699/m.67821 type:complete len:204 (-) Transcript_28699:20-631(-)
MPRAVGVTYLHVSASKFQQDETGPRITSFLRKRTLADVGDEVVPPPDTGNANPANTVGTSRRCASGLVTIDALWRRTESACKQPRTSPSHPSPLQTLDTTSTATDLSPPPSQALDPGVTITPDGQPVNAFCSRCECLFYSASGTSQRCPKCRPRLASIGDATPPWWVRNTRGTATSTTRTQTHKRRATNHHSPPHTGTKPSKL